ncbi:apoptotic protease-activating factor 1 isoform X2 [Orussus abietinus]|uniref:apoptotic protease-activating factor 1 isoform X2 n=1 Tax=Orussus abietinus TaxID=222816 RepID=UPI000626478D|nr:apoptotic protease-activating factor 1 isoform X2 [Orussus abietinus]
MEHMYITKQLQRALEELQPGRYVALHGMKGFGKSSLTASTLKDGQLVKNLFSNEIHWIKFGYNRSAEEEIITQLSALYYQVKESEVITKCNEISLMKDTVKSYLKHHFRKSNHRKALLVLDDVYDKEFIDAFDFDCKTLVITSDIDALEGKQYTVIEMNDGFTEAESLNLFAKVLDIGAHELPHEAKLIHEECKGMPLLIAMFSAQFEKFKHDMRIRSDRWKYYLKCLRKKDPTNKVMRQFLEKQKAIFDICIDRLPSPLKERYEMLAIFNEDVNIMPQTLEILWEEEAFQVEEMMLDFCHKSLAAKQWNDDLKSYIYGVHDLLLCYLRDKLQADKLKQMHVSFIEKYRKYCNNDFSKLPRDNYSHSYIGNHLEQAELYEEFPKLYLDFDFLQAKIYHAGLSDLLNDLQKYRKYITNNFNSELEAKVADIELFLQEHAYNLVNQKRKECLDLIQVALSHSYQHYVKQKAKELVIARPTLLYLTHDKQITYVSMPLGEEVSTEISIACFTDNPNEILIGNRSGETILWNCSNRKEIVFHGHHKKYPIKKIIVSEKGNYFASLSEDGTAKLFDLMKKEDPYNFNMKIEQVPSPRQKQTFWNNIFVNEPLQDNSLVTFVIERQKIIDISFGFKDQCIAACTKNGTIQIWDLAGNTLWTSEGSQNYSLRSITFTTSNTFLHLMDEEKGVLISYKECNKQYTYCAQYNPKLQDQKVIFFQCIPRTVNSLIIVTKVKAIYVKWFGGQNEQIHSYNKQIRAFVENENIEYLCAALTYDGQYIVVADSGGFVNVWNIDVGDQPIAVYKGRVTSLDTYWLNEEEECHLICGSENKLIHRWKFEARKPLKPHRLSLMFDAIMSQLGDSDVIAKETSNNTVIVSQSNEIIGESGPADGKLTALFLWPNKKKIVYASEKGTIAMYDLEKKETVNILSLKRQTSFIWLINIDKNEILICNDGDNHLKIWENAETIYLLENTGNVIATYALNQNFVVTVAQTGLIKLWNVRPKMWLLMSAVSNLSGPVTVCSTCLGSSKTLLAVLHDSYKLTIYNILANNSFLASVTIKEEMKYQFEHKVITCEFSHDERYLAVGSENGDILIINVEMREEMYKFLLHSSAVTQLLWAPSIIDLPILLSVSCDDLAWWNISLLDVNSRTKKRSRMGISHSISSPEINVSSLPSSLPCSKSTDFGPSTTQQAEASSINGASSMKGASSSNKGNHLLFWKVKKSRDPKKPALLGVVQLPGSYSPKICASDDFSKFLVIDVHGSIHSYKLFELT